MPKMSQILIKGQKVTRPPRFHEEHKLSSLKNLQYLHIGEWLGDITGKLWRECAMGLPSIDAPSLSSWPLPIRHTHFANAASVTQNKHWNHVIYTDSLFPASHSAFFPMVSYFHHGCNNQNRGKEKGRHLPIYSYRVAHCWYRESSHFMISQFMILAISWFWNRK